MIENGIRIINVYNIYCGKKIIIELKLTTLENATKIISESLILKMLVIKYNIAFKKVNAIMVRHTLKRKLPNTILFFRAEPPIAPKSILMVVPVSEPKTIEAPAITLIAPALIAVSAKAIVTELDCTTNVKTNPINKKVIGSKSL